MVTRQESKQIVDFVIRELYKRRFSYVTDGKVDLSLSSVGTISGATVGGQIAGGAIYDSHINIDAKVQSTKIKVVDTNNVFVNNNVEDVLYELFSIVDTLPFIELVDTPNGYPIWFPWAGKVPVVNTAGTALEWKPLDYIEGGLFTDTINGGAVSKRSYVDGGTFVGYEIIDGGSF